MRRSRLVGYLTLLGVALAAVPLSTASDIPHLEKRGAVTQLIVEDRPFLVLAGELRNSSSSSLEYMKPIWPQLVKMNLNTVLAVVSWEHQATGSIGAVWLNRERPTDKIRLGDYTLEMDLRRNRRAPNQVPDLGYGLAIALGPDEYVVSGSDVQVTFSPYTPGPAIAGLLSVEEGTFANGRWIPGRRLNGDEVQLRYDLSAAAAGHQSAAGLRFGSGMPTIQRVRLYRYR